jgi:hypothetical protein
LAIAFGLLFADVIVITKMHTDIVNDTAMVVHENTIVDVFVIFTALGDSRLVLGVDTVEISVDSFDLEDKEVQFRLG